MLLSAVAQDAFRQVRGGRLLFAELLRQPLQVCTMHRGKAPPKPARRRLWRTIPEARRDSRLSCRDIHQDGPRYQRQFGQPLTTLWSKDDEASIEGARGILLNISGGSALGLFEVNEAAEIIHSVAHPDANIIFGAVIDDEMGDEVRVTVIAAGFDRWDGPGKPEKGAERPPRRSDLGEDTPPPRDIFADDDLDLGGDDDFDVPSFLK